MSEVKIIEKIEMDDALEILKGFSYAMEEILRRCEDKTFSYRVYLASVYGLKRLIELYDQ